MSNISKKMMMPQNKREDLIFTVLNVVFMCTCMLIFNMFLSMGISWDAVKQAWLLEPLTLVVVFCLEYFVGCPFVKMLMKKNRQTLDETLDVYSIVPTFHSITYGNFRILLWRIAYSRI